MQSLCPTIAYYAHLSICVLIAIFSFNLTTLDAEAAHTGRPGKMVRTYYHTRSGGYDFLWRVHDIVCCSAEGKQVLSVDNLTRRTLQQVLRENSPVDGNEYYVSQNFRALSLVGPILTLQCDETVDHFCQGLPAQVHPACATLTFAIDLRNPKVDLIALGSGLSRQPAAPEITSVLPTAAVLKALANDKVMAQHSWNSQDFRNLNSFHNALKETPVLGEYSHIALGINFLNQFSFHHVQGDRVAVRIHLAGFGQAYGAQTQVGLLLPMGTMRAWLQSARTGTEGFLQVDPSLKKCPSVRCTWIYDSNSRKVRHLTRPEQALMDEGKLAEVMKNLGKKFSCPTQ